MLRQLWGQEQEGCGDLIPGRALCGRGKRSKMVLGLFFFLGLVEISDGYRSSVPFPYSM